MKCENCLSDVLQHNSSLHLAFCQRNVWRCSECGDVMQRDSKESHMKLMHEEVKCECGEAMQARFIPVHLRDECPLRSVCCQYCHIALPAGDMSRHEIECGSRTELCEDCDKYVRRRDIERHNKSGCDYVPNSRNSPIQEPEDGGPSEYSDKFECPLCHAGCNDFEALQVHMLSECPNKERADVEPLNLMDMDGVDISTPEIPVENHEGSSAVESVEENSSIMIPCQFCSEAISVQDLDEHQSNCENDREMGKEEAIMIPCEICQQPILVDDLAQHQRQCASSSRTQSKIPCEYCQNSFEADVLVEHEKACKVSSMTSAEYIESEELSGESSQIREDDVSVGSVQTATVPNKVRELASAGKGLERTTSDGLFLKGNPKNPALSLERTITISCGRNIHTATRLNMSQIYHLTRFLGEYTTAKILQILVKTLKQEGFDVKANLTNANKVIQLRVSGNELNYVIIVTEIKDRRSMVEFRRLNGDVAKFRSHYLSVFKLFFKD